MQNVTSAIALDIREQSMIRAHTKEIVKIQTSGDTDANIHQVIMC